MMLAKELAKLLLKQPEVPVKIWDDLAGQWADVTGLIGLGETGRHSGNNGVTFDFDPLEDSIEQQYADEDSWLNRNNHE